MAEAALAVVRSISAGSAGQDALRGAKGISILVRTLDALPADRFPRGAARAATCLSNMVIGNTSNRQAVGKAGVIPKLVSLLDAEDADVRVAANEALGNLAVKNAANKDEVREAGGVKVLAQLYRTATGCGPSEGKGVQAHAHRHRHGVSTCSTSPATSNASSGNASPASSPAPSQPPSRTPSQPCSRNTTPRVSRATSPPPSTSSPVGSHDALMPPGSGEGLPAAAATAPSVERLRWALHNLTAGSGLNSAVVVACGVPVEELQPPKAHSQLPARAASGLGKAKGAVTPPPPPPPVTLAMSEDEDDESGVPPSLNGALSGVEAHMKSGFR